LAEEPVKVNREQSKQRTPKIPAEAAVRWMTDLAAQGILMTDRDLTILSWNRWLEVNTGRSAADMVGHNLLDEFPDLASRGLDSYYRDAINGQVRVLSQRFHRYLISMPVPGNSSVIMKQSVRIGPLISEDAVVGTVTVVEDVTERVEREAELIARLASERAAHVQAEEARQRVTDILESITDSYFSLDRDWRFTDINRTAELSIFARPREELIGKIFWDEYPEGVDSDFYGPYGRVMADRVPVHFEAKSKIARDKWFEAHSYPSDDGICVYLRDITERKNAEQEREHLLESEREARKQAEVASRTKDEFLSTLSHELRTPLNAIIGWAHLLSSGSLAESDTPQAIEIINRNAQAQARLIEDMLDVSRIITGKLRLEVQKVDPATVVSGAVETVRLAADAKEIQLDVSLDFDAGYVQGDPVRLQQVVWNLLSNAVKFTSKGGHIQIELRRAGQQVTITVTDTGPGIEEDFLPYIFERFRQADSSSTRRYGGLGLGLAIVRHLTELHGGTVEAANRREGSGAVFTVTLPASEARSVLFVGPERPQTKHNGAYGDTSDGLADIKVMIVEDEPDALRLLTAMLESRGAKVVAFSSAAQAMATLNDFMPDVLVSDIGMPGESGYDLIGEVRACAAQYGDRIPAIALTAYARAEDRIKALSAGFDMHLSKPIDPEELALVISSLAASRKALPRN